MRHQTLQIRHDEGTRDKGGCPRLTCDALQARRHPCSCVQVWTHRCRVKGQKRPERFRQSLLDSAKSECTDIIEHSEIKVANHISSQEQYSAHCGFGRRATNAIQHVYFKHAILYLVFKRSLKSYPPSESRQLYGCRWQVWPKTKFVGINYENLSV